MTDVPASRLIRRICHDLTQPLTALQGYIELALHFNQSMEEMRQSLLDAGEEAERLAELMRAVRCFADALAPFTKPQPVHLKVTVADAIAGMPLRNGDETPAIFAELEQPSGVIVADPDRLKTAFQQILDFFLAHAAAPLAVSLEGGSDAGRVMVSGRGSNLTPTDCAALFDPHFRQPAGKHVSPSERFRLAAAALTIQRAGGAVSILPGHAEGQLFVQITFVPPAD